MGINYIHQLKVAHFNQSKLKNPVLSGNKLFFLDGHFL